MRALAGLRIGAGLILAIAPRSAFGALIGQPRSEPRSLASRHADDTAQILRRALGARMVLETVALARWPRPRVLGVGVAVNALHAASMVAVACGRRRYRRAAVLSAVEATTTAACLAVAAAHARRSYRLSAGWTTN